MKKPKSTKITHEGIVATMRDMIDIFSASQDKLRTELTTAHDQLRTELTASQDKLRTELTTAHDQLRTELTASQDRLREDMTASHDQLRGEFVSFKTEMYEFERGHNLTLQHHTAQLERIEEHLIDHRDLESRVRQLEKVRS